MLHKLYYKIYLKHFQNRINYLFVFLIKISIFKDIFENVSDSANFNQIHGSIFNLGIYSEHFDKIKKHFRFVWQNVSCNEDPNEKHTLEYNVDGYFVIFGLKTFEIQYYVKFLGPAHFIDTKKLTILNIFSINLTSIGALINTGPLSYRMVDQFVSGYSFSDIFFANFGPFFLKDFVSILHYL